MRAFTIVEGFKHLLCALNDGALPMTDITVPDAECIVSTESAANPITVVLCREGIEIGGGGGSRTNCIVTDRTTCASKGSRAAQAAI